MRRSYELSSRLSNVCGIMECKRGRVRTQFTYDPQSDALGRVTSYGCNSLGQKTSMVEQLLPDTNAPETTFPKLSTARGTSDRCWPENTSEHLRRHPVMRTWMAGHCGVFWRLGVGVGETYTHTAKSHRTAVSEAPEETFASRIEH